MTGPKEACEGCGAVITWIQPAYVCSSECTFCPDCAEDLAHACPNCSEPLAARPKRTQPLPRRGPGPS